MSAGIQEARPIEEKGLEGILEKLE